MYETNHQERENADALAHVDRILVSGLTRFDDPEFDSRVDRTTRGIQDGLATMLSDGLVDAWQLLSLEDVDSLTQFLVDQLADAGEVDQSDHQHRTAEIQRTRLFQLVWPLVGQQAAADIDREICAAVEAGRIGVDDLREPQTAEDVVALLRRVKEAWGA